MLVLLAGIGVLAFYQVMTMEDQLDDVTRAVDQMDGKVKRAQYEKGKFFSIAKDVLRVAQKDPSADQIADDFKLKQLQLARPELLSLDAQSTTLTTNAAPTQPAAATNAAPIVPFPITNAAPVPTPAVK
jgi:TolA-binding protein